MAHQRKRANQSNTTPTRGGGGENEIENDELLLFIESGGRDKRCHIFAQIHNR